MEEKIDKLVYLQYDLMEEDMITKLKLNGIGTYSNLVELNNLPKVNFFFGSNGTGKTSISKLIANPDNYLSCEIEWKNNQRVKTIVYNEDFVRNVFYQSDNFPGVFTIGEGAKKIEEEIKDKKEKENNIKEDINALNNNLQNKRKELSNKKNNFRELCWKNIYKKYQSVFNSIFTGFRNSKEKFAEQLLKEFSKNKSELQTKEYLSERYNLLYKEDIRTIDELSLISDDILDQLKVLESDKILKTKIIGKKDVDIAKMIEKLHNHDWVRKGKEYYEKNYDEKTKTYVCPFCQQSTTEEFKRKLEEYFDETYENQIKDLNNLLSEYNSIQETLNRYFESLVKIEGNKYLDGNKEKIMHKISIIQEKLKNNSNLLESKKAKPSESIEIESTTQLLKEFDDLIISINSKIKEHNNIVSNKNNEKNKLNIEIWKFFCNEINTEIQSYLKDVENINKAIRSIEEEIEGKNEQINIVTKEISELERNIKSVKPTVNAINKLLSKFGFQGFKLEPTEDEKHYRIIREDGTIAKETLSEGERNFILFLYFYHLIQGALDPEENITESKIVVFDDPVSSLDSDVLFIVATLIKDIVRKVRNNESNITQVFVLTHNVFFFKEVTYISQRESRNRRNDTMYYIVRKSDNISNIEPYEINPIKTTYQVLWDQLKKDTDCINIQNTMRRIIEFYFKLLAEMDEEELIKKFEDEHEKKICRSLVSWMNVGSHDVFSDIDYTPKQEEVEKYKEVFKEIFKKTGHIAHYNMMKGD